MDRLYVCFYWYEFDCLWFHSRPRRFLIEVFFTGWFHLTLLTRPSLSIVKDMHVKFKEDWIMFRGFTHWSLLSIKLVKFEFVEMGVSRLRKIELQLWHLIGVPFDLKYTGEQKAKVVNLEVDRFGLYVTISYTRIARKFERTFLWLAYCRHNAHELILEGMIWHSCPDI